MTPTQLPMFLDPTEIVENTINGDWGSIDNITTESDWRFKLNSATYYQGNHGHNLADMKNWDVFVPIVLMIRGDHVTMGNGHHRVAMAEELEMPFIPVVWDSKSWFAGYPSKDGESVEYDNEYT